MPVLPYEGMSVNVAIMLVQSKTYLQVYGATYHAEMFLSSNIRILGVYYLSVSMKQQRLIFVIH